MSTCTVIPTVSAIRRYRPLLLTLVTATLAASLALLLTFALPGSAVAAPGLVVLPSIGPASSVSSDSLVLAARVCAYRAVDDVVATV